MTMDNGRELVEMLVTCYESGDGGGRGDVSDAEDDDATGYDFSARISLPSAGACDAVHCWLFSCQ